MRIWQVFPFLRAVAIALSLIPLSALADGAGLVAPIPAAIDAERDAGAGHRLILLDRVNAPATDCLCCKEPTVEVQSSVPVRLRDAYERPALAFHTVIFRARGIPAQITTSLARSPGLALSRFILFGNFRS